MGHDRSRKGNSMKTHLRNLGITMRDNGSLRIVKPFFRTWGSLQPSPKGSRTGLPMQAKVVRLRLRRNLKTTMKSITNLRLVLGVQGTVPH